MLHRQQSTELLLPKNNNLNVTLNHEDRLVDSYHCFDAFWKHESVVERIHSLVAVDVSLALQENRSSVKAVVCPEYRETSSLVALHQSPKTRRSSTGENYNEQFPQESCWPPGR